MIANMETSFMSSNVFTKTTQLLNISRIESKNFINHRKNCFIQSHKHGISVTYCQLGGSSSDEDITPKVSKDWRSFRAKLVAAADVGDRWAHPIHEPEKGCILIATEKLDGDNIFERTVILIIATGTLGPIGLILNRPSLMSIKETKSRVLDRSATFLDRPLYFGGPLHEGLFLVSGSQSDTRGVFDEVMKGLCFGTRENVECAAEMVKRGILRMDDVRFFDGYCGWEKEQLRDEIREGYWTVAACSQGVIGLETVNSGGMWEEINGLVGPKEVW